MISLQEAMEQRHAMRTFEDRPLAADAVEHLQAFIAVINEESWMDFKLVLDEPLAFASFLARKVGFANANNYLAVIGPDGKELDNSSGYYGEQIVLRAQQLGINSCWVGQTYKQVQGAYNVDFGESLRCVVALGYGTTSGTPHPSKTPQRISPDYDAAPDWFRRGVDAALLAPTALNQQKFSFRLGRQQPDGTWEVIAKTKMGPYTKVDLGIAKYHFEIGAGEAAPFTWKH